MLASPYDLIINELNRRGLAHSKVFPPYYIASIGCHIFNLINQEKSILMAAGDTVNTRLSIIMVAPPGYGKSVWLRQFLASNTSMLQGSNVSGVLKQLMTEAGLVGQVKNGPEGPIMTPGVAHKHSNSIIGMEEFSAITNAMQQQHNANLDNALLGLLDDGHVVKDVGPGSLDYFTNLTLWGATQPARYQLSSGMGRRLLFVLFSPTMGDVKAFTDARRGTMNIRADPNLLGAIRQSINLRMETIQRRIAKVEFHSSLYQYLSKLKIPHYEEILYERLALGYHLMKDVDLSPNMVIGITPELEKMFNYEEYSRFQIKQSPERAQICVLLHGVDRIPQNDLKRILLNMSMSMEAIREQLRILISYKWIKIEGDDIVVQRKDIMVDPITKYFGSQ